MADPYLSNVTLLLHMEGANNGTVFRDTSPVHYMMDAVGNAKTDTTQFVFGTSSAYFDGTGDGVRVHSSLNTDHRFGANSFTVEGRFRFDGSPSGLVMALVSSYSSNSGAQGWRFYYDGTNLNLWLMDSGLTGRVPVSFAWTPTTATWYALAVDYDAPTTTYRLYIDGAMVAKSTTGYTMNTASQSIQDTRVSVGRYDWGGSADFKGWADEIRITAGVARYASDAGYTLAVAAFDDGPTSRTTYLGHMDGTNGSTTFTDNSSLVLAYGAEGNAQVSTAQSVFGGASVLLDGTGDAVRATLNNPNVVFGDLPFTVEARVYNARTSGQSIGGSWSDTVGNANWFFFLNGSNLQFVYYDTGGTFHTPISFAWTPTANTWYALAVDKDSSNKYRLYINGSMVASATDTSIQETDLRDTKSRLAIGRIDNNGPGGSRADDFSGYIDEFRITKGAALYGSDAGYTVATSAFTNEDVPPIGFGALTITGYSVTMSSATTTTIGAGALTLTGFAPTSNSTVTTTIPGVSSLALTGYSLVEVPALNVSASAFGLHVQALNFTLPRISQFGLLTLAANSTILRMTQMGLLVLAKGGEPPVAPDPLKLVSAGRAKIVNQRMVNMHFEPTPEGPSPDARFSRGGLKQGAQRGAGPVYALFSWQGYEFTVSGTSVWRDNVNIGTIVPGDNVRWATSETEIVLITGGKSYYVTTTSVAEFTSANMPNPVIDVIFTPGGRFLYLGNKSRFYWSDVGDAQTIDGLSFATAEQAPDNLVGAIRLGSSFVLMGTASGEWWYATGDDDNPFELSQGRTYTTGLAAIETLRALDNSGYFLGSDRVVYRMEGVPQRVSDFDLEEKLKNVSDKGLATAWALTAQYNGHKFYVLSLSEGQGTWALDVSTNRWIEWKSWGQTNFRGRTSDGDLIGDQFSGKIMVLDGKTYDDVGDPLERITSTYLRYNGQPTKNFNLELSMIRGVGLATGYGSDPVVEMRFSDTEGHEFSDWMPATMGKMGEYGEAARAVWDQLGYIRAPGRLYEFRVTDPVNFTPYKVRYNEKR